MTRLSTCIDLFSGLQKKTDTSRIGRATLKKKIEFLFREHRENIPYDFLYINVFLCKLSHDSIA